MIIDFILNEENCVTVLITVLIAGVAALWAQNSILFRQQSKRFDLMITRCACKHRLVGELDDNSCS